MRDVQRFWSIHYKEYKRSIETKLSLTNQNIMQKFLHLHTLAGHQMTKALITNNKLQVYKKQFL